MTHDHSLSTLAEALDEAAAQGRRLRFWLRDDDASEPTPALERLIDVTSRHAVPCLLAVIPATTGAALAARLDDAPLIEVAVHGWAHTNHAPTGEKKQELGTHRPQGAVSGELTEGLDRLRALHSRRLQPILVPPWNRIAPEVIAGLPALGFRALSVFGAEKLGAFPLINTHVDLIDWHGTRGGRSDAALSADIVQAIRTGTRDIGLLTHHLVHDEPAWAFLERVFDLTDAHPACTWRSAGAILEERTGQT